MNQDDSNLQDSYDQVAEEYVTRFFHELEHKPLDRELLDRFALEVRGLGPACDMGCGPGHVAHYLYKRGNEVLGIDLSPRMVELARQLTPAIEFHQGNMLSLDVDNEAWGGIVAFYSIIHIPREAVIHVLKEFKRVLRPNGLLLLAFHQGQEIIHLDEWWGKKYRSISSSFNGLRWKPICEKRALKLKILLKGRLIKMSRFRHIAPIFSRVNQADLPS